jgi:hypothetical protein
MKRWFIGTVALAVCLGPAGRASAQGGLYGPSPFGGSYGQPALSPYLNMLRGGSPAANYYLGVVPELERRTFTNQALNNFLNLYARQNQTRDLLEDTLAREPLIRTLPPTGHPTGFLTYGTYFNNLNRR